MQTDGREVQRRPAPDEWLADLARLPLLYQPGEAWLYDTCSDLQGILVARASGQPLPEFFAERIFAPLGMRDTGFVVTDRDRFTSYYRRDEGGLVLADGPDGDWSRPPAFPEGSGGLASTADDWLRFARMLLADGAGLLSPASVRLMTTDHLTDAQRAVGELFLEGQGWGFGGSVDINTAGPGTIPGRYGWVGGSGHVGAHRAGPRVGGDPAHPGRHGQPGAHHAVPGLLDVRRRGPDPHATAGPGRECVGPAAGRRSRSTGVATRDDRSAAHVGHAA